MIRHYLITAARTFARHRLYTFINVFGLAVGLASAIFIVLYVRDQLSYDRWLPDSANLYRLEVTAHLPGRPAMPTTRTPFAALTLLGQHVAQVQAVTHVVPEWMTLHIGDRAFHESVTVVDPNFLQVIRLPLLAGDPQRALAQPESVLLSQSAARKYFGNVNPVGRTLTVTLDRNGACAPTDGACMNAAYSLTVTGVLRDLPHNTQLAADVVIPNTSRADELSRVDKELNWGDISGYGYAVLAPGARPAAVIQGLNPVLDRTFDLTRFGINLPASKVGEFRLTPFADVHLTSDKYGGMTPGGSWTAILGLLVLGGLIVLIACFNFMNLATARAMLRCREIAVRKLGGANRGELIVQFMGEAVLLALISLAIALSIVEMLLPAYDRFLGAPITLDYLRDWDLVVGAIGATVLVGLLSGAYPAFVLSAFRPAAALKPNASAQSGSGLLRSILVVAQFSVSIALAIGAVVVLRQLSLARTIDLGFDRDGIVVIYGVEKMTPSTRDALAHALERNPQIVKAAYSTEVPFGLHHTGDLVIRMPGEPQTYRVLQIDMSPEFPQLYGMRLVAGRLLSADRGEDVSTSGRFRNVLITEATARRLGVAADRVVGKDIQIIGPNGGAATVVGVLRDAKFHGIDEPAQPIVFAYDVTGPRVMALSVRIRGDAIPETLDFIDRTWRSFAPGTVVTRQFLSDAFEDTLRSVQKEATLVGISVTIAICIACLGLLGLAVFTAQRRTKEIGVRKIAGARTVEIVGLLLWRASIPVLLANVIAWPIAYYALASWLSGYAYRVSLSPLYFIGAGAAALVIAWATVFAHALRLAQASAVHALRYE